MKKIFALLLALVMIFALAACEKDKSSDKPTEKEPAEQTTPTTPKYEEYEDEEIEVLTEPGSLKEPVTAFDKDGIRLVFTKLEKVDFTDHSVYRLHYELSNKNKFEVAFAAPNISVNGIMFDDLNGLAFVTAAPGEKVAASADIYCEDLEEVGITEIRNIKCYDGNIWSAESPDYAADVTFELDCGDLAYKTGLKKSGKVIYDKDGVKMIYKGLTDGNREGSKVVTILVVNESGKDISLDWTDIRVNGVHADDWNYAFAYHGTGNYVKLVWLANEIEEFGGEMNAIEFLMSIWSLDASENYGKDIKIAFDL